ncbi:glycoside hydrolase family 3 protein [Taibaiella lutea]|uniref:beta-N-acetylhexosaminidase n=1 Tax=Taibaiella lutea TaxID=2608001 RepID=A0A5M6CNW1_9BACT|nr:glycoside hydrolase family 3 N-terminal domain-containing protein [Taibaiella lutea]KAA5534839.1 glycoside hydrolase family 3 protein [Taibaiella lutea]
MPRITLSFIFLLLSFATVFSQESTKGKHHPSTLSKAFYHPDAKLNKMVDSVYNAMSLQERASQMIMTASSTAVNLGYPFNSALNMVSKDIAANVVFLKGSSTDFRKEANQFNTTRLQQHKLQPLLACDCEPTLLPGKFTDITDIAPASEQKTTQVVIENTNKINKVIEEVGIQLNFAPVVDIALNKSVINKRSFGNNNKDIITFSGQFVETTQQAGLGATLKHFPGHGAVSGDSHKQSVYIDGALTELPNFKALILADEPPIAVMVGHIVVKNNEKYNTNGLPSTLSRVIVTDLLRKELHFEGIITTDALNMVAAAKVSNADWKSVEAGVDLVLMPKNAVLLNKMIADALSKKDAMSKQLEASVKRIIRFKLLTQQ